MKKNLRSLLILLLLFSFFGCVKAPPRTALDAEQSRSIAERLKNLPQDSSLSAFVQVKVQGGGRSEIFDAALLVLPPNRLLIQILDELGQERLKVVADGSQVLFYDATEAMYSLFPQKPEALKKTLRLPIEIEALVDRLLRRLPPSSILSVEAADAENCSWVQRENDRLCLEEKSLRVFEAKLPQEKWTYRVNYQWPQVEVKFRRPKIDLVMEFKDIDRSRRLLAANFDTTPPPGAVSGKIR
ncbi:MAG TPA: hypothetical protein DF383_00360 [Deltaproteobacteria bacterium]|nr:hypothetical protein [Deltaproteobacteria bacterium]